jgi:hypothetical protein
MMKLKNTVVIAMDGVYAGNAGAISCHLIGEECVFYFIRCIRPCVAFRDSIDFSRIMAALSANACRVF